MFNFVSRTIVSGLFTKPGVTTISDSPDGASRSPSHRVHKEFNQGVEKNHRPATVEEYVALLQASNHKRVRFTGRDRFGFEGALSQVVTGNQGEFARVNVIVVERDLTAVYVIRAPWKVGILEPRIRQVAQRFGLEVNFLDVEGISPLRARARESYSITLESISLAGVLAAVCKAAIECKQNIIGHEGYEFQVDADEVSSKFRHDPTAYIKFRQSVSVMPEGEFNLTHLHKFKLCLEKIQSEFSRSTH